MSKKRTRTHVQTSSPTTAPGATEIVTPQQVWSLFRDHLPLILYLCRMRVAARLRYDEHLLERILSDVFERFAKAVERERVHRGGVPAWFRHVVPLAAGTHAGTRRKEIQRANYTDAETIATMSVSAEITLPEHEEDPGSYADPEQQLIATEARAETELNAARLRALLDAATRSVLTPREKQVLDTALPLQEQNVSDQAIAALLEITVERLRSYLSTAKRRLDKYFVEVLRTIVQTHAEEIHTRLTFREHQALQACLDGVELTIIAQALNLTEAQMQAHLTAARGKAFHLHLRTMN